MLPCWPLQEKASASGAAAKDNATRWGLQRYSYMSSLQEKYGPRFRKIGKGPVLEEIIGSLPEPQDSQTAHATAQKLLAADKRELAKQMKGQEKKEDPKAKSKAKPKAKGKAKAKAGTKPKKEKKEPKTNWARRKNSFIAKILGCNHTYCLDDMSYDPRIMPCAITQDQGKLGEEDEPERAGGLLESQPGSG